jgi:hypothetical protein
METPMAHQHNTDPAAGPVYRGMEETGTPEAEARYTLDATKDGRYFEDHGLTADQVDAARTNADQLGITILSITEEREVDLTDLAPFKGE